MNEPVKRKRSGAYSKNKGKKYEQKIVNELKELSGDQMITTSRNESKKLDDLKIDVFDPNNTFPCYFQLKNTQTTPSVKKINEAVGLKDKPLCILWNIQIKKTTNCVSGGEYAIIPKELLYDLLKRYINE